MSEQAMQAGANNLPAVQVIQLQAAPPSWHADMEDSRRVKTRIGSIQTRSAKLDADTQHVLVQCVMHAARHGDITLIGRLLGGNMDDKLATASVFRSNSKTANLRDYVSAHSPIRWNGEGKVGLLKASAKTYTPFNIEGMIQVPFWEHTSDQPKQALTWAQLLKIVEGMASKIDKAAEEDRFADDADDAKAAVVAMLNAGKAVAVKAKQAA